MVSKLSSVLVSLNDKFLANQTSFYSTDNTSCSGSNIWLFIVGFVVGAIISGLTITVIALLM